MCIVSGQDLSFLVIIGVIIEHVYLPNGKYFIYQLYMSLTCCETP